MELVEGNIVFNLQYAEIILCVGCCLLAFGLEKVCALLQQKKREKREKNHLKNNKKRK